MPNTVLIAEDNALFISIYKVIFEDLDCQVTFVDSAKAAQNFAERERPDLIILDLHLSDGSGEDVLRKLRGIEATRGTPIIIVSTSAGREEEQLRAAGATAILPKPIRIDSFTALVRQYLN